MSKAQSKITPKKALRGGGGRVTQYILTFVVIKEHWLFHNSSGISLQILPKSIYNL